MESKIQLENREKYQQERWNQKSGVKDGGGVREEEGCILPENCLKARCATGSIVMCQMRMCVFMNIPLGMVKGLFVCMQGILGQ